MHPVLVSAPSNSDTLDQKEADDIGKTSLTQQYIAPPTYQESYFPTIEATSHKSVKFNGQEYDCEIIDSAGQVSYADPG